MFQTELILFLQSFETDFLNFFFLFWTDLGFSRWTLLFLLIIFFGVSFRNGIILIQAMTLSGLTSLWLKDVFALPRPAHVDLNVKLIGESSQNLAPFESQGAKSFFGRLPQDVVESLRANPPRSWGFPSGHTSIAATLGGMLFLIVRKPWMSFLSLAIVVFVPLSRMYLGRHFLADVLGGYIVGLVFVVLIYKCSIQSAWLYSFLSCKPQKLQWDTKVVLFFFYIFILPFLLLLFPKINHGGVAAFLGFNIGFVLVWNRGIPEDRGTVLQRIARIVIALIVFILVDQILGRSSQPLSPILPGVIEFIRNALTVAIFLWGSTMLCIKLGLYKRPLPPPLDSS
jgi:membrane-associated phospholipid phosphatase